MGYTVNSRPTWDAPEKRDREKGKKKGREVRKEEKQSPCQKLTESQVYSFKVTRSTVGTLHHLRGWHTIYNNPNAQTEEKKIKRLL